MNPKLMKVLYVALAAAVLWYVWNAWNSTERQIERRLGELADTVAKDGPESGLAAANTSRRVGDFLARDFEIHAQPFAGVLTDRARLSQVVFGYRSRAETLDVEFRNLKIVVDERLGIGDVSVIAAIGGKTETGRFRERYRFALRWVEEDDTWRLQRAELLEILEGPAGLF